MSNPGTPVQAVTSAETYSYPQYSYPVTYPQYYYPKQDGAAPYTYPYYYPYAEPVLPTTKAVKKKCGCS